MPNGIPSKRLAWVTLNGAFGRRFFIADLQYGE